MISFIYYIIGKHGILLLLHSTIFATTPNRYTYRCFFTALDNDRLILCSYQGLSSSPSHFTEIPQGGEHFTQSVFLQERGLTYCLKRPAVQRHVIEITTENVAIQQPHQSNG